MIRINIIGKGFLDMSEGAGLSFKRENQQFRFCDITLGRSVEFTVPATRHNRELLDYGDDPSFYGGMLRKNFKAQVVYGLGALDASLKVTAFEGDSFKCVLFLETFEWLEDIKDLKLADMVCPWTHGTYWDNSGVLLCSDPNLYTFLNGEGRQMVLYDDGVVNGNLLPSICIKAFIEDMLTERGVPNSINIPKEYWLVMPTAKGTGTTTVTMVSTGTNDLTITGGAGLVQAVTVDLEWATGEFFGALVGGGSITVKAFKALEDIDLTFPSPFPTDCFLVQYSNKLKNYVTLGGVDLLGNKDPHGDESVGMLDGVTVSLKKGYIYFFAPNFWMVNWGAPSGYVGYKDTFNPFSFTLTVSRNSDLSQGELWYLANNMPDMTILDFIRSAALAAGMEVTIDRKGLVVDVGRYGSQFKECHDVISVDNVARTVDAWGSGNRTAEVSFDSEDYVTNTIRWGYFIDNEQLEGTKENKVKFSEGDTGDTGILIKDIDMSSTPPRVTAKKPTIAYADPLLKALQRVPDVSMAGYDDIATDSTCVRIKMKASESEFFGLEPTDVWLWRGMAYVWTDANWSDGMLTLTLQKVSQAAAIPAPTPPPVTLDSIKAEFTQGGAVVVGTDSLDTLKQYLTVTATYSDSSTRVLADNEYTLSGTLAYPSATVTVDYQGETDSFTVAVAYDAEVEYLKSTGTQWIDTAIILQETDSVEIDAMFLNKSADNFMMGATAYSSGEGSVWIEVFSNTTHYVRFGSSSSASQSGNASANMNVWRTYKIKKGSFYVDGVRKLTPNYAGMPTRSLVVFGRNNSTTNGGMCEIRKTKITRDNTLVLDLIPVRCGTTGYMYDRVSGTLFGNDGTGNFVVGADV